MKRAAETKERETPHSAQGSEPAHDEVYRYEHSGIAERHGTIPLWLILVTIGLIVWGIYYTVRYWSE